MGNLFVSEILQYIKYVILILLKIFTFKFSD